MLSPQANVNPETFSPDKSKRRFRASTRASLLSLSLLLLAGCISYESHREGATGPAPNAAQLAKIELGETPTGWLLEQFGDPDAVRRPSDDIRIWQYEKLTNKTTRVRAFPLISVKMSDEVRQVYNFEIENDRVVKYWQESP